MSRKGENIYKRKDGRWEGRYIKSKSPSGKTQYGYVYAKTYRDAKEKLRTAFASHSQECIPPTTNIIYFSVIASEWLNSTIPQVKESTINKYCNLLQSYILPVYGEIPLSHITHDFIECQCNNLLLYGGKNKSGLSSKTVMDTLSVIRTILKFAVRKGIFVPCNGMSVQIKQVSTSMRILSSTEQERLCSYLNSEKNPYNIGILVCLFTGLRVGEICALHWEDISFSEQTLYVHQTLAGLDIDTSKYDVIDESQIAAISKGKLAQGDKAAMDVLGDNWGKQQAANILGDLARNPGAGGMGAMGAGMGMGMAAGSVFGNMANQMFAPMNQNLGQQSVAPPQQSPASVSGRFAPKGTGSTQSNATVSDDPIEILGKLKKLLDAGLIEQSEYDSKKREILSRM